MKQLIVTADDFGLTESINKGIEKAYGEGIVSYLNFMPAGEAFEDALEFTKRVRLDEMGAHLSLTQNKPLTDPAKIPTLVAKDGRFHRNYGNFLANFFLGRIDTGEIRLELKNQLDALGRADVLITSLSSHEHIHMVPDILDIFIKLAKECKIPYVRCLRSESLIPPVTMKKLYKNFALSLFVRNMEYILKESGMDFTDNFLGFLDSGNLQESILLKMLGSLKDGTTELVCHPGFAGPEVLDRCVFHANCETELSALTGRNVKALIRDGEIRLIKYGGIIAEGAGPA